MADYTQDLINTILDCTNNDVHAFMFGNAQENNMNFPALNDTQENNMTLPALNDTQENNTLSCTC